MKARKPQATASSSSKQSKKSPPKQKKDEGPKQQKPAELPEIPIAKCMLRQMNVVLNDEDRKIRDSGKWPLLIDISGKASTFLTYQGANYLCAFNSKEMEEDRIRMGLLGAIRYGKLFVIDLMDTDMFEIVKGKFDAVQTGLMDKVMKKEILSEERYMSLVKESDASEYQSSNFEHHRIEDFGFVLITRMDPPPRYLLEQTYPIRIENPN